MADQVYALLSPWLRRKRIEKVRPFVKGKILDFGCGIGYLSELCLPEFYVGLDEDNESLEIAHQRYPNFRFVKRFPEKELFDTAILLAVIEHVRDPEYLLTQIKQILSPNGRIVLTTPHPMFDKLHRCGASVGIFSRHASKNHKQLIDFNRMYTFASKTGLRIILYEKFLLGANQLFILEHEK